MREGFVFENADKALEFFEACEKVGAKTYEQKLAVLRFFAAKKKTKYIRDADEFIKGKKVLRVTKKEKKNEGTQNN